MTLDELRSALPEYARDLRLNLQSVLSPGGAPGLNPEQIWLIALAAAIAAGHREFARNIEALASQTLSPAAVAAAKTAAALMAMTNVYYRFTHLSEDPEYRALPARLRMNVLASPGVAQPDFELAALAVSAVNGCAMCMNAHDAALKRHGLAREAVQSAVRIAAVINAAATAFAYERAA